MITTEFNIKMKSFVRSLGINQYMEKETFKPTILLQFIVPCGPEPTGYIVPPPREPSYLARIVRTYQGLHLETEKHDAMGNSSWQPADEIPRWVKALIEACTLLTPSAAMEKFKCWKK